MASGGQGGVSAKEAFPPTPEETFQLYLRTFVHFDTDAARTLHDALVPRYGPGIITKPEEIAAMAVRIRAGDTPGYPLLVVTAGSGADPEEQMFVQSMQRITGPLHEAYADVTCTVADVSITHPGEPSEGKIATLAYTCLVPDVSRVREALQAAMDEPSPERMEAFVDTYIAALRGPRSTRVKGEFLLFATETADAPWYDPNHSFISVLYALQMALVPFTDLHEETEAAKVPPRTGVPVCDVLIARHRACMARRAPDSLPVVEGIADELEQMSADWDAKYMARHCKTLHLAFQTLWGPECFATP